MTVPSGWSVTQQTPDSIVYSPNGDTRQAGLIIVRDAAFSGDLSDVLPIYSHDQIVATEKILVDGRECLHAVGVAQARVIVNSHWLVCDLVGTPYPGSKVNFALQVVAAQGNNYGIDPEMVFFSVVDSIEWRR